MSIASIFHRFGERYDSKSGGHTPAVLGSPMRFPYGPFQLSASVFRGAEYEIHASTDLRNWTVIGKGVSANGTLEYVDGEASKFSARFYRVQTEGVVSTNVLGYAAVTLAPGFSMIANPFDAVDSSTATLFKDWPNGTTFNKFDTRFHRLSENAVKFGAWVNPGERLQPGEGGIFFNPTSDYKSHTFVGEVQQGQISIPVQAGFSVRSSPLPLPGRLDEDLKFPIADGDVIHLFDRDAQKYVLHPYENGQWTNGAPLVSVGESFWVAKTSPGNWIRTL